MTTSCLQNITRLKHKTGMACNDCLFQRKQLFIMLQITHHGSRIWDMLSDIAFSAPSSKNVVVIICRCNCRYRMTEVIATRYYVSRSSIQTMYDYYLVNIKYLGPGLLRKIHVKIIVCYERYSVCVSDMLAAVVHTPDHSSVMLLVWNMHQID